MSNTFRFFIGGCVAADPTEDIVDIIIFLSYLLYPFYVKALSIYRVLETTNFS